MFPCKAPGFVCIPSSAWAVPSARLLSNDTARLAQMAFPRVPGKSSPSCCWHCPGEALGTAVTHIVPPAVAPGHCGPSPGRRGGWTCSPIPGMLQHEATLSLSPACLGTLQQHQIYSSKLTSNPSPSGFSQCHPQPCPHTTKSWEHLAQHPKSHFSPQISQLGPEGQPRGGVSLWVSPSTCGCNGLTSPLLKNSTRAKSVFPPEFYNPCSFWGW